MTQFSPTPARIPTPGQVQNILVVGVNNRFGEEIIKGLAVEQNALILCGSNSAKQKTLSGHFPNHIKATNSVDSVYEQMALMAAIERQGSLDGVVYLMDGSTNNSASSNSKLPKQEPGKVSGKGPSAIQLLRAVHPYLRKNGNCKVVLVDTEIALDKNYFNQKSCLEKIKTSRAFGELCDAFEKQGVEVSNIGQFHDQAARYSYGPQLMTRGISETLSTSSWAMLDQPESLVSKIINVLYLLGLLGEGLVGLPGTSDTINEPDALTSI